VRRYDADLDAEGMTTPTAPQPSSRRTRRRRIIAGAVGGGVALAFLTGVGPAPSLLAATSGGGDDGSTTSTTAATAVPTADATAPSGSPDRSGGVVDAAGAGTVTYERNGNALRLVDAIPSPGWRVEVEEDNGRELEADFRRGSRRVQVNIEFEDGAVRERVRIRDLADGSDIRIENGTVVRTEPGADRSGADDRGGADDMVDDRGGRGGTDDMVDDHGTDDRFDDHGGSSGHSGGDDDGGNSGGDDDGGHSGGDDDGGHSGRGGDDDPPGDDHDDD
jgi:hypothetical protein